MNTKLAKKSAAILIGLLMAVTTCVPTALAASSSAPKFQEIDYDKYGKVEVDFYGNVKYYNPKVTVKDSYGNTYSARITDRENYDDEMEFKVYNIKGGRTYTFTISGIKKVNASSYTSVTGKFWVPAPKTLAVKSVEYDSEDREVSFEFKNNIVCQYARPLVKITAMDGTQKTVRFLEKDRDSIEVRAKLTRGAKYNYTIYNIKACGASDYRDISGTFYARDND